VSAGRREPPRHRFSFDLTHQSGVLASANEAFAVLPDRAIRQCAWNPTVIEVRVQFPRSGDVSVRRHGQKNQRAGGDNSACRAEHRRRLIRRWLFDVVDDEDVDKTSGWFQLQTNPILTRRKQRHTKIASGRIRRPLDPDIVRAGEAPLRPSTDRFSNPASAAASSCIETRVPEMNTGRDVKSVLGPLDSCRSVAPAFAITSS
jgi:hypothetical protein